MSNKINPAFISNN